MALSEVDTFKGARPALGSHGHETKLGNPKVRMMAGGDYELNFSNSPQPFPKLSNEKEVNGELTGVIIP